MLASLFSTQPTSPAHLRAQRIDDQLPLPQLAVDRMALEQATQLRMAGDARKRHVHELRDKIISTDPLIEARGWRRLFAANRRAQEDEAGGQDGDGQP
jgi:hypothetical protein